VLAGHRQPLAVHLMVAAINSALGNIGNTIALLESPEAKSGTIAELTQALNEGAVDTLVVLGGNPVYDAPADLNWAAAQAKAKKTVVRLGYYEDESFPQKGWGLPLAHFLESWGDARTSDGTHVSIQPLIEPLFGGITELELLARFACPDTTSPYEIVRQTFRAVGKQGEENWKQFLHDGYLKDSAAKAVTAEFNSGTVLSTLAAANVAPAALPTKDKLEVIFHRDYRMDDGRFNNNGWMQELPDPITKMTWENVILMSVKTADDLGLKVSNKENNRIRAPWVKIELDGRTVEGPVWTQPGQADNTIALALGYGREQTGRVGRNSGYNAYQLRTTKIGYIATGGKITGTGQLHHLSVTQDHGAMEGRPIIREATLKEYAEHPKFAKAFDMEKPPLFMPLYTNPFDEAKKLGHHQWGMSVDLSACVGCSSCMVACQS